MTPEERDQLIQRYYDGETLGAEAALAEKLVAEDPEAAALLESLQDISDSIRVDIAEALAREDFSHYWDDIAQRLPSEPATLDDEVVAARAPAPITSRRKPWFRWLFGPALSAGALAALAVVVMPGITGGPDFGPVTYAVEIESVESDGAMVIVTQATDDAPAIVSFQESRDG